MQPPRRILIVRLSALGDATMLLAVAHTLARHLPGAEITWLIGRGAHALLEGAPGIRFVVVDKPRSPRDYLGIARAFRGQRFDALLAMQATVRANLIYPLVRAERKIGFDLRRARCGQWLCTDERIPAREEHILDGFFAFAERLGVRARELCWPLALGAEEAWAGSLLRACGERVLAINPLASKPERDWPPERVVEVALEASRRWRAGIVLTGDGSARAAAVGARVARAVPCLDLVGRTTPKQLAAVLKRADCLLSPDSGPVHVARAVGTPVVGLYTVAPAALSGPYGAQELVVDRHEEAVRAILRRDPRRTPWGTRVHGPEAMRLIRVEDVLDRLELVFGRARA